LAVSLIKQEDTLSFKWVFAEFFKAMGSEPTIMFTDGDVAMGAALRMFPAVVHLLCIFHMGKNLETHAQRLFPGKENKSSKDQFVKKFKRLMYEGYSNVAEAADKFDADWNTMMEMVMEATPCPGDLGIDLGEDDVYQPCEAEATAEDDAAATIAFQKRKVGRKNKPPAWLAWQWLKNQYAIRYKWARAFVIQNLTFSTFSTQRSESWHASLKRWQKLQKRLLQLCKMLELKRAEMTDRNVESSIRYTPEP